jgi:hypothetical protein
MEFTLLRREGRLTGAAMLSAPVFGVAVLLTFVVASRISGYGTTKVNRQLGGGLEMVLPLAAAIVAVFAAVSDPCLELQLSLPIPYRRTVGRRVLLALAWTVPLGPVGTVYLRLSGHLATNRDVVTAQLVWLAPTLWLVAVGMLAAMVFRSAPAAAALVAIIWLFEQIQHDNLLHGRWTRPIFLFTTTYAPDSPTWLPDRLWLVTTAFVPAAAGAWLLRRPERLLRGDN